MEEENNRCMRDTRPFWKRKLAKIWAHRHLDLDLPKWAKDGIVCDVQTDFSIKDRLLILIFGRARTKVFIATEFEPGKTESKSIAHPSAPKWLT